FDPPGETPHGLRKLTPPAVGPDDVLPVDLVLLSHDHHDDNLDISGQAFLPRAGRTLSTTPHPPHHPLDLPGQAFLPGAGRTLTTTAGAERLDGNATGMEPWESLEIERPGGQALTITAVPAQHGPDGTDHITGPVIGFVLTAPDVPTLYVSGDNASVDVVRTIADRAGPIELAILFTGGVSVP